MNLNMQIDIFILVDGVISIKSTYPEFCYAIIHFKAPYRPHRLQPPFGPRICCPVWPCRRCANSFRLGDQSAETVSTVLQQKARAVPIFIFCATQQQGVKADSSVRQALQAGGGCQPQTHPDDIVTADAHDQATLNASANCVNLGDGSADMLGTGSGSPGDGMAALIRSGHGRTKPKYTGEKQHGSVWCA